MTRSLIPFALAFGAVTAANCQSAGADSNLPPLRQVQEATLGPSYSCRPKQEFTRGYEKTALFLTNHSQARNSPELLFNGAGFSADGACASDNTFDVSLAGDDMSLIADLGAIALEDVSASRAFQAGGGSPAPAYTRSARVRTGHTYAVLMNNADRRGLFVFTVLDYEPNKSVRIRYSVKGYDIRAGNLVRAASFDWSK